MGTLSGSTQARVRGLHHWPGGVRMEACRQGRANPIRVLLTRSCRFRKVLCCRHPVLCTAPLHGPSESLARPEYSQRCSGASGLRTDGRTDGHAHQRCLLPGFRGPGSNCQAPCREGRACARLSCWRSAHLLLPAPQAWGWGSRSDERACGLHLHSPRVLAAAKWH